jgi:hypothetical protein
VYIILYGRINNSSRIQLHMQWMRSFLCSDGRSNKTLSAGSPTVEIKFTTARGLKNASRDLQREKTSAGQRSWIKTPHQLRDRPRMWASLIHNGGMERALRKEQLPISFWTIRRQWGLLVAGGWLWGCNHHYFLVFTLCTERIYLRLCWRGPLWTKNKRIITLVETVRIGKGIGAVSRWVSGIQCCHVQQAGHWLKP